MEHGESWVNRVTEHGLYVDVRGDAASKALLYIHGGPGQGAYPFMAVQGDRFADDLRVIGVDHPQAPARDRAGRRI